MMLPRRLRNMIAPSTRVDSLVGNILGEQCDVAHVFEINLLLVKSIRAVLALQRTRAFCCVACVPR